MIPVATVATDATYAGIPDKGIGDLPTETSIELLADGTVVKCHRSRWRLDDTERAAIAAGGQFVLDVLGGAVPPMRVRVSVPPPAEEPATAE